MSPAVTWLACAGLGIAGLLTYTAGFAHGHRDMRPVIDYYRRRVAGLQQRVTALVEDNAALGQVLARDAEDFRLWDAELGRRDAS